MRRSWLIAVKVVVSIALLIWILRGSNLEEVLAAAADAHVPLLLVAYSLNFVGVVINASRWRGLLHTHGVQVPLPVLVRSVMVGAFFNNFLPSTVGGDAMRAYDSFRFSQRRGTMSSVVVDRLLGLLVLSLFALASVPFAPQLTGSVPLLPVWVALGAAVLAGLAWAIFLSPSGGFVPGVLARLPEGIARPIDKVLGAFRAYAGQRSALAKAFGWSVLLQANVVVYYIVVARALGFDVPTLHFFLIVPLAMYIMMVPITVNGIGLRENLFALFLGAYAIGSSDAIAYAWLVYLGGLILGVVGGLVYAVRRVEPILVQGSGPGDVLDGEE
ncbi:MAG: flippase-like domain-containing protein [Gemmatimonadetes bacterium]|nr:flippase-like domain-containing protein [Gemmatimonadota bacterium]